MKPQEDTVSKYGPQQFRTKRVIITNVETGDVKEYASIY
jgi:hypothetical protein